MKIQLTEPPRVFEVGINKKRYLKDCAHVTLEPDEQVTFLTETGAEYDVTRKSWGFYATPSLNGRLRRFALRAVLVRNVKNQYFILLVEKSKEDDFQHYVHEEGLTVVTWMDDDAPLRQVDEKFRRFDHS